MCMYTVLYNIIYRLVFIDTMHYMYIIFSFSMYAYCVVYIISQIVCMYTLYYILFFVQRVWVS